MSQSSIINDMDNVFVDKAIPLIQLDEKNNFNVNPQALSILKRIEQPIQVVSVAGMYRTGKSYLLNSILLNRKEGFPIGSTINVCTKGIWMWGTPLRSQTEDNRFVNTIILDSEGFAALDQDASYDSRVFALVMLLSSTFLYNSLGAIDETMINSLSLVINLTKHIQIKSRKVGSQQLGSQNLLADLNGEDDDYDQFAEYFPSFLWILRDFTLQLVDEYGDQITPKQYLENALELQTGFSDEVEQKNRIRTLIKAFFQNRNCFPLVRPLSTEEGLKNIQDYDITQLRQEFMLQAIELRKIIFSDVKIKQVEGVEVSGEMLGQLLKSYTEAINGGAVPNIENAWSYVCKTQTKKVMEECIAEYNENVRDRAIDLLPLNIDVLNDLLRTFKQTAFDQFEEGAVGEGADKIVYRKQLHDYLRESKKQIKQQNDNEFEQLLDKSMNSYYTESISTQFYQDRSMEVRDLTDRLQEFRIKLENLPDGPRKDERIYRFLFDKSIESFMVAFKHVDEYYEGKFLDKEKQHKLEQNRLNQEMCQMQEERKNMNKELKQREKDNDRDLQVITQLRQKIEMQQQEHKIIQNEANKKQSELKEKYQIKLNESQTQLAEQAKKNDDLSYLINFQKQEYETKMALLDQKMEQLNKQLEESQDHCQQQQQQIKKMDEQFLLRLDQNSEDTQDKIIVLNKQLEQLNQQIEDQKTELKNQRSENERLQQEIIQKEKQWRQQTQQQKLENEDFKLQLQNYVNKIQTYQNEDKEKQQIMENQNIQLKLLEKNLKEKEDANNQILQKYEQLELSTSQQNDFNQIKIQELQKDIEQLKKLKETSMSVIPSPIKPKIDITKQLQELKENYEKQNKKQQKYFDEEKEKILLQYEQTEAQLENVLNQTKAENQELLSKVQQIQLEYEGEKETNNKLRKMLTDKERKIEELQSTQQALNNIKKENIIDSERKLRDRDEEIQQLKQQLDQTTQAMQQIFDQEIKRLEKKVQEEKMRGEKNTQQAINDIEALHENDMQSVQEEMQQLQEQIMIKDMKLQNIQEKSQAEFERLKQRLEQEEQQNRQLKQNYEKEMTQDKSKILTQQQNQEQERKQLIDRIDGFKNELAMKNNEFLQLKSQLEMQISAQQRTLTERDKQIQDAIEELNDLRTKMDQLQNEKQKLNEDNINLSISLNKEQALKEQKVQFLDQKILDLQAQVKQQQKEQEECLQKQREQIDVERHKMKKYYQEQIQTLESKYEELKRSQREGEQLNTTKLVETEKANQSLNEKIEFMQDKFRQNEQTIMKEKQQLENELKRLKESQFNDRQNLLNQIDNIDRMRLESEQNYQESINKLEQEKVLLTGNIKFLQQQYNDQKGEISEHQEKLNNVIQQYQQMRIEDKQEMETQQASLFITIEQKHENQLQDLKDQHKQEKASLQEKIKFQEQELKKQQQTLNDIMLNKNAMASQQEKKIIELTESEKSLNEQIEKLRQENLNQSQNYMNNFDTEKEILKKKIQETEYKLKKAENEKQTLGIELKKYQMKINIQQEQLTQQKMDSQEMLDRIGKQKDQLQKEIDKLKNDIKILRKSNVSHSILSFKQVKNDMMFIDTDKGSASNDSKSNYADGTSAKNYNSSGHDSLINYNSNKNYRNTQYK